MLKKMVHLINVMPDEVLLFAYRHSYARLALDPNGPGLVNTYEQLKKISHAYGLQPDDALMVIDWLLTNDKEGAGRMSDRDKRELQKRINKIKKRLSPC